MKARHRPLSVLLALLSLAVAGCTSVHSGLALPNQTQATHYQANKFDTAYQALQKWLVDGHDEKGTVYWHATFAGKSTDKEIDTFRLGNPTALLSRSRSSKQGDTIDTFHPAGSPYDYLLLGSRYANLAAKPWVQLPTLFGGGVLGAVNVCLFAGIQTECAMEDALTFTMQSAPSDLVKQATSNADGTIDLLTGITLDAFIKGRVLPFPDELLNQMTPAMKSSLLPVRITLGPTFDPSKYSLTKIEINGTINGGPTPLAIQVGYQVTGTPTAGDFPALPDPSTVTVIPDQAGAQAFYDKLNAA